MHGWRRIIRTPSSRRVARVAVRSPAPRRHADRQVCTELIERVQGAIYRTEILLRGRRYELRLRPWRSGVVQVDTMPVKEMYPETLHRAGAVVAERARLDQIMLPYVLTLKVGPHGYLPLKAAIANWAMVGQRFGVGREVLGEVVFAEEPFLADAALVRFDARVPHLVPAHVRAVREFHVAHVAFEHFSVNSIYWGVVIFSHFHFRLV